MSTTTMSEVRLNTALLLVGYDHVTLMIASDWSAIDTTWTRRMNLERNKCFVCHCSRCSDPTELGSHVSSLLCPLDSCSGILTPLDTLNMLTPWSCDKCASRVESETVRSILKGLQAGTQGLQRDDINSLKSILKVYTSKLHKNHTLVTEVKQLLVSGLGRLPGFTLEELSDTDLRLKLVCCQQLLSMLDIISPGLTLGKVVFIK